MRRPTKIKSLPIKAGSTRQTIRFAWLPVETKDNKIVWLERYLLTERFETSFSQAYSTITYEYDPKWRSVDTWSQDSTMWKEWSDKL